MKKITKKTTKSKIAFPQLPGKLGKMTAEELDREVAQYDQPNIKTYPLTKKMKDDLARTERRGRKRIGRGAEKIRISMERGLLERADQFAKKMSISRSELIANGLRMAMAADR